MNPSGLLAVGYPGLTGGTVLAYRKLDYSNTVQITFIRPRRESPIRLAMPNQNESDATAVPAQVLLREGWSRGDLALVDDLVTGCYVQRDPIHSAPIRGPEALKEWIARFREAVPDLQRSIEQTLVDGDVVAVHYTASGTHQGGLVGLEPTGRDVAVDGVFVCRVKGGRLTDGTDLWDVFGLLSQLDGLPTSITHRNHP